MSLFDELTRRGLLERASVAAVALSAGPLAATAGAQESVSPTDGTLQAFFDTILPGRRVTVTATGAPIHPRAIAGVDREPGGVEADALALAKHPKIGFDALAPAFLTELESRSVPLGGPFLELDFERRVRACVAGLDYENPARLLWEAAAAVPFTAFCAAALIPEQTAEKAVGYRVMGLPGVAPRGYRDFSYRRRLSRERTRTGNLG
jgi:hypothetical protein